MPASVRRKIQLVFQDPHASLNPRRTVRQTLLGPLRALVRSPVPDRAERARAALEQVGLEAEFLDRYPHQLSGGQAQRVGIARALSVGPEVVIFDEAVASLDVTTQSEMVALLEDLQKRLGLSYVFISHDLLLVGALAQKVMVLQRGEVVEQGPAAILKGSAKEAYTKSLIDAIPKLVAGPRFALAQRDPPTADHPRRAGW